MDVLVWTLVALAVAFVAVRCVVKLGPAVRRESRRIDTIIANADEIIASDREEEWDEGGARSG